MSLFQDALSMFKKKDLLFIESYKESEGVYTFLFEKENDLSWIAGQHGLFTITHKKIKNKTRPFTIASAPTENVVRITTRISENPSEFKKAMLELKQGMKINLTGPIGSFNLKDDNPSLLIAGGIGITPFRSILKQIESDGNGIERPIRLLYLDSNKSFIFKDELDVIAYNTSISVNYLDSRDDLYQEIDRFTTLNKGDGKYFIAGPKPMVKSIFDFLKSKHIPTKNINKDVFDGC
ncbi:FAD-dependent oxidoreductase [Virgibacillus ihumii]|uniref:FAD-dependent oxidoreductase n=1 Tax=Virgibacillus ihumii TaxID=2686091 RepID=UPI00157E10C8|nr:FAD-dependent oxidoreductase [Virgibacillus ihumii]